MSQGSAHVSAAHAPPSDEPKSPLWLPVLGGALFLAVGLWWAVTPSAPEMVADADAAPTASAVAAPPPPPSASAVPQMRPAAPPASASALGMRPAAPGASAGPARNVDPKLLQRLRDQMKKH
jgi:hypothetical protein